MFDFMRAGYLSLFVLINLISFSGNAQKITKEELENLREDTLALEEKLEDIENQYAASDAFMSYKEAFVVYLETLDQPKPYSEQEMLKRAESSDVILFGDDHSNALSQENFMRLIRAASKGDGPVTVVIEWVDKMYQSSLDAYMAGEIGDRKFMEEIEFDTKWGFEWASHLKILKLARELGLHVMAVENKTNKNGKPIYLRTRDNNIVRSIAQARKENEDMRFVVSYGSFHLAGGEDPHIKEKLTAAGLEPDLVAYPYSNGEYWKVLEKTLDMDKAKVLRYSDTEFFYYQGSVDRVLNNLKHYLNLSETSLIYKVITEALRTKGVMPSKSCDDLLAS